MKNPAAPATGATSKKKLPKKIVALKHLLTRPLVQLEAFNLYGETCLHSTISHFANKQGLVFIRERVPHKHRNGGTVYFMRYTLSENSREKAQTIVDSYKG